MSLQNSIQYKWISKEAGLRKNKQRGGIKNHTVTSRYWKLQYGLFYHTTSQLKKLVERNK